MTARRRLSALELRERVLTAAKALIDESGGLTVSLSHLNLEEIIRAAGVPRSSVYREWDTKEDFYLDLMVALTEVHEENATVFDPQTYEVGWAAARRYPEAMRTVEGRRRVLGEVIRVAARRNYEAATTSRSWQTITALCAMLPSLDEAGREVVRAAVIRVEGRYLDGMVAFLGELFSALGFRFRPPFTAEQLAVAGSAVVGGMVRRSVSAGPVVDAPVPFPGIDGEPVEWSLVALGYLGIANLMIEPIPGWCPPD